MFLSLKENLVGLVICSFVNIGDTKVNEQQNEQIGISIYILYFFAKQTLTNIHTCQNIHIFHHWL